MAGPVRLFFDPLVLDHGTGPMHPENGARIEGCVRELVARGFRPEAPASPQRTGAAIEEIHSPALVERLRAACAGGGAKRRSAPFSLFDSPDNPISGATFEFVNRTAASRSPLWTR